MSDELDTATKVGGGLIGGPLAIWFFKRFVNQGDRAERKVAAAQESRIIHCEKALEAHRELIATLNAKVVELDTRLKFREGAYGSEPLTTPGVRPTPQLEAYRAEMARRAKEEGGNG